MDAAAFEEAVLTLRSCVPSYSSDSASCDPSQHQPLPHSQQRPQPHAHPPRCRPWSEADYFRRLRTFNPQTWFGKPLVASPPRCAAHGWVNDGMDRLRCEGWVGGVGFGVDVCVCVGGRAGRVHSSMWWVADLLFCWLLLMHIYKHRCQATLTIEAGPVSPLSSVSYFPRCINN